MQHATSRMNPSHDAFHQQHLLSRTWPSMHPPFCVLTICSYQPFGGKSEPAPASTDSVSIPAGHMTIF